MSTHSKIDNGTTRISYLFRTGLALASLTASLLQGCSDPTQDSKDPASAASDLPKPDTTPVIAAEPEAFDHAGPEKVAEITNQLAFKLYDALAQNDEDLCFSPISVATVLSMGLSGARTTAARELETLLGLEPGHTAHAGFKQLLAGIEVNNSAKNRLVLANAFMHQQGMHVNDNFLNVIGTNYDAEVFPADFARRPGEACEQMNSWVERNTDGRIPKLLNADDVNANTCLILANTLLFDGAWASTFDANKTTGAPFHREKGGEVIVSMMYQQAQFSSYIESDEVQIIRLPYAGERVEMVVILPTAGSSLSTLENGLTPAQLSTWLSSCSPQKVDLHLPRFKARTEFALDDILFNLGVSCIFAPGCADFSGMTSEPFWISRVKHACYVEADEEGTKAAAATAMVGTRSRRNEFRADRPFLYLIRETTNGTILLMGRVVNPR